MLDAQRNRLTDDPNTDRVRSMRTEHEANEALAAQAGKREAPKGWMQPSTARRRAKQRRDAMWNLASAALVACTLAGLLAGWLMTH